MRHITTVQYDPNTDEYFFTLPQEMLDTLGWKPGDTVQWIDNKDGTFAIKRDGDEKNKPK